MKKIHLLDKFKSMISTEEIKKYRNEITSEPTSSRISPTDSTVDLIHKSFESMQADEFSFPENCDACEAVHKDARFIVDPSKTKEFLNQKSKPLKQTHELNIHNETQTDGYEPGE